VRIALVNLTGGGLSGGYRKYLRTLVPLLRADPRVERVQLFSHPTVAMLNGADGSHTPWPPRDHLSGYRTLRRLVRESRPDVVFIPSARWLDFGLPTAAMVRNMEPLVAPIAGNPPGEAARNLLRAWVARRSARRATRVIAVSHFVREHLTEHWAIPASRIDVIYHGVDSPGPGRVAADGADPADGDPFLLTVGSLRPARGLEDLLTALAALRDRGVRPLLRVAGSAPQALAGYERRIRARTERLGLGGQVTWLGEVGPERLAALYRQCAAFVMTTRAEACPNTALEAMSNGALCVSTDAPPMPEMFGDAALYYSRENGAQLAEVMHHILVSAPESARTALRRAALERSRSFTWAETASRTVDALESMTQGREWTT
jgi:glycosyltransferase involved in cell wall biosynthesis